MSELFNYLKTLYLQAKSDVFEWKPIYPNNIPCKEPYGVYTEFNFPKDDKYQYLKYSIQYMPRVDETGLFHLEDGTKYFILHELRENDLDSPFEVPEPSKETEGDSKSRYAVNNYGRFMYVFDDEITARKAVRYQLLHIIFPYTHILSEEEGTAWNEFLNDNKWVDE